MFISAWPTLNPLHLLRPKGKEPLPFPLSDPGAMHFYVARNGIYHLCQALGLGPNDVILVPEYHHGNEVGAIRAAGAGVRFYPIRRDLEPDMDELARLCRTGARALLLIHYLGWPQPVQEIARLCRQYGITLIEDCALSFLSEVDGRPLGTTGDYSIFCLYKTIAVPNGGVLVQNQRSLPQLTELELNPCSLPTVAGRTADLVLTWMRGHMNGMGGTLANMKTTIGRAMTAGGMERVPVGDTGFSVERANLGMSPLSRHLLARFDYPAIVRRRRGNFFAMRDSLQGAVTFLKEDIEEGVCPLFFPILVEDKHETAQALWKRGVDAVEFWNQGDARAQLVASADTRFLRQHVLELPVHQEVTSAQMDYMVEQVRKCARPLNVENRSGVYVRTRDY